jgi:4-amino-4-deoxy-L-arabinose transferase-like glycosyltransferase
LDFISDGEGRQKSRTPMPDNRSINRAFLVLLLASLVIRAFVAGFIELGNDEVYYVTYARYPDWSHFDHPAMVGWLIQLFTLNLLLSGEFFIRLGAVVIGTINTWLIFRIGSRIKDPLTGLYAALFYTASFYCFVISGIFIMPDTPQGLFWLLTLYLLLQCLPDREISRKSRKMMLLAGITIGLAILSKYHSVFLIAGAVLYILFFNRRWLKVKETYIAAMLIILLSLPILIWNQQNDFISFTFHEERIDRDSGIRWDFFLTELAGQILYNNPVNVLLFGTALVALARRKMFLGREITRILLFMGLPLILVILPVSLFNPTLPHWTGPAYYALILLAAAWLSGWYSFRHKVPLVPWPLKISIGLLLILIVLGVGQIRYGWIPFNRWRMDDFSAQMQGWRQLGKKFHVLEQKQVAEGRMKQESPVVSTRWFPAANLEYYVARPAGLKVYALGTLERIHKYFWIGQKNGCLEKGSDAWFITFNDDFSYPENGYGQLFDSILPPDTIPIIRRGEVSREAYVYRFRGLQKQICFDSLSWFRFPPVNRIHYWIYRINATDSLLGPMIARAKRQNRPLNEVVWEQAKFNACIELLP